MKRLTKSQYYKELSNKNSDRARRGWKTRHLRRMAQAGEWESFEDICARAKQDQKGKHYATWYRDGLRMEISYSLEGRSDQFDVTIIKPDDPAECHVVWKNLSIPKCLKLFQS